MKSLFSALALTLSLAWAPSPWAEPGAVEIRSPSGQETSKGPADQADSLVIEGHAYRLVRVGGQTWLGENLRVARDRNGEALAWGGPEGLDKEGNGRGKLYTWDAARRAAPAGWRLPTVKDWQALILRLGGGTTSGRKLLLAGAGEFGARLVGGVDVAGRGLGQGELAVFWTSAETSVDQACCLIVGRDGGAKIESRPKSSCFSVRLIKDDPPEFRPAPESPGDH